MNIQDENKGWERILQGLRKIDEMANITIQKSLATKTEVSGRQTIVSV